MEIGDREIEGLGRMGEWKDGRLEIGDWMCVLGALWFGLPIYPSPGLPISHPLSVIEVNHCLILV